MCGRLTRTIVAFLIGLVLLPGQAGAAEDVTFTVTSQGAYFHTAPSVIQKAAYQVVLGQAYIVVARTLDNAWLQLQILDTNEQLWLPALFGRVNGSLNTIPVQPYRALPSKPIASHTAVPGWIPVLTRRDKAILQQGAQKGRDPHMFTLAGDSNSVPLRYLGRLAGGMFPVERYPVLLPVISYFDRSFTHVSVAVGGGFRAADMFLQRSVMPPDCYAGESLFACELRVSNASIVIILLGTGDKFVWHEFEANYRSIIEYALATDVLPVLVTKVDDIESYQGGASYGYINGVIRRLAVEYQLPLVDLYAATRSLPTVLNPALPNRPFTQYGLQDEWGLYFHLTDLGQDVHVLATLQTLYSLAGY